MTEQNDWGERMVKVRQDLTDMVFGRLRVIKQIEDHINSKGEHFAQWLCECSCDEHNQKIVLGKDLKSGHTQSCGCLQKENTSKANKRFNDYNLEGDYGIGYCHNTNNPFYFDLEDYDQIKDYCWYEHEPSPGYHTVMTNNPQSRKTIKLWYVLGFKGCDHINKNPMDCRKANLRPATQQENMRNISLQKNNTSGVTGVSIHKQTGKWRARIMVDYKEIALGLFDNKEDAIKARLQAEIKYFGKFAGQKHLFEQYDIIHQSDCGVEI